VHLCKKIVVTLLFIVWDQIIRWFELQRLPPISATNSIYSWWKKCRRQVDREHTAAFDGLVLHFLCNIWKERNRCTFQQVAKLPLDVAYLIKKRYTTPSVQRTHRTSYGVVVVRLPRGVNFLPFRVFCWGNLLFFVQLGGPGRTEFGALGWSCVVVEMLCVGLILFVFVFFLFFLLIKFTAKICGPVQKK
jgi:hypothetical protein